MLVHPEHGVVRSCEDEEELQAQMADMRPSILKRLQVVYARAYLAPTAEA